VGMLAWIVEKYWAWSDHRGDLWETIERDDVLTTVMLYWLTGCTLSAARIYYEHRHATPPDRDPAERIVAPTFFALYPGDPWEPPLSLMQPGRFVPPLQIREQPRGGHFPALEQPELWSRDVAAFFAAL
jgi:epoxide hydrolase